MTTPTPFDDARGATSDDPRAAAAPAGSGGAAETNATREVDSARGSASATPEPSRSTKQSVHLDPELDEHPRRGITGGTWVALILGAIVLILLLIFIVQNNVPAEFAYFGMEFSLPLGVAMLAAAIAGVLVTALLGSIRLFQLNHRLRKLEKERQSIRKAVG